MSSLRRTATRDDKLPVITTGHVVVRMYHDTWRCASLSCMGKQSREHVPGFVLRSGYVVPFDGLDTRGMVDHLKNAILGESLQRIARGQNSCWDTVATELVAEITHVIERMPPDIAHGLLIGLLSDAVFERLRAAAVEQHLDLPETIQ